MEQSLRTTRDGRNAVRLSGTISTARQGWWKCRASDRSPLHVFGNDVW
ncbi:MAG: hypothetical protein HFP77_02565 [Methylococcales symbiont of Iophon sp. n. MRB-2018]|nr:MAG: hypothetical protein HFP77_02565 [Methylococcales symbiont of Iophon sp. n. MRB-2018]KAF3980430.1 MAG: hypothetical protein HFP76_02055 [Methylococcales symbiont of Iophon sp. n. MRB-2018]